MTRQQTIGLASAVLIGALVVGGVLVFRHFQDGVPPNTNTQSKPGVPELLSPAEGASLVNGSSTAEPWSWEFRWSDVPGAEKYHLQVLWPQDEEPEIDKLTEEPRYNEVYRSNFAISDGSRRDGWRWKVRAQINGQWSEWSKVRTFNVDRAAKKPTVSQEEYDRRITTEFADVYLIFRGEASRPGQLPAHDDVQKASNAIPYCLDAQSPDGRLEMRGDGPLRECWKLGLVKDVEAFGLKQKFGRVRAYDPEKRALIIEVGLPPTPRGEWKGATDFDRLLTAYTQRRFVSPVVAEIEKDHPAEQLAYLQFRGQLAIDLFGQVKRSGVTEKRLKALPDGPVEKRLVSNQVGARDVSDVSVVVAPVKDFGALVQKIDFAEVLFSDPETKVLILGPLKKKADVPPKEK